MSFWDLVNPSLVLNWRWDVVTPGAGAVIGQVTPQRAGIRIVNDSTARVPRRVSGFVLRAGDVADIDPYTDRISPVLIAPDRAEWRLGVYAFASDSRIRGTVADMAADLYDETVLLDDPTEDPYGLDVGGYATDALEGIIGAAGLTDVLVQQDHSAAVPDPQGWLANTPRRTIAQDLCELVGYWNPYQDNGGTIRCGPVDQSLTPSLFYSGGAESRAVNGTIHDDTSFIGAPNVYIVASNGAVPGDIVGVFEIPDSFPHSVANLNGRRIPARYDMQGIPSSQAAVRIARLKASDDLSQRKRLTFTSLVDPRHDTHDIIDFYGEFYRELSWDIDCAAGTMVHTCQGMVTL